MENTLEKIFKFDKREKEESKEFSSFINIISGIGSVNEDESQENVDESIISIVDIMSGHLLSDTFDGKITLAAFNKFVKQYDIDINDEALLNVLLSYFLENSYSTSYTTFIDSLNRLNVQDKKIDFLNLIIFSALKDIVVPTKNLNVSTYRMVVDRLNKFLLLCIFNDWKRLGFITSTNLDNINRLAVINRYLSTLKTALFNVYSKFIPDSKNCFDISNEVSVEYNRNFSINLHGKNGSLAYQLRAIYSVDSLYEKYRKAYISVLHERVKLGSTRFRLSNHFRSDAEILMKSCSLELKGVQVENQNYYYSSCFLTGDFKLTINLQNILQQGNIDYKSGFVGGSFVTYKQIKSLPLDNMKQLVKIYNEFGYKVNIESDIEYNGIITNSVDTIYKYRHNAYCNLSLFNLKNIPFLHLRILPSSAYGKNYNTINKSLNSLLNTVNLASTEISFESMYSTKIDMFMPFIFFILDISYSFSNFIGSGYGELYNPLFSSFSDVDIANSNGELIINEWLKILRDNRKNCNIEEYTHVIDMYTNFKISDICALYRIFLSNLPFDETKDMSKEVNIFLIHFNEFINNVISLIDENFKNDNLVNSYDFSEFKYLNEAISRIYNKEEVL